MGEYIEKVRLMNLEECHNELINKYYNDFLSEHSDVERDESDPHGHGKKVPYIGWFWRSCDFATKKYISIGDCGKFIGFMQNNKWGYDERFLTEQEVDRAIEVIDAAIAAYNKGGSLLDLEKGRDTHLAELWDYIQTLKIEREDTE